MYGIGFLVLSIHEASFGILQFSPLRARIVFVGFTFAILAALPVAAFHYGFSYFGPMQPIMENRDAAFETQRGLVLSAGFLVTATLIALPVRAFLFLPATIFFRPLSLLVSPVGLIAYVFAYYYFARHFTAHPSRIAALAWVASAIMGAAMLFLDRTLGALILWMWLVTIVSGHVQEHRLRYALDYRNWYWFIAIFALYVYLFGSMQARFGGGAPTPVTLYLDRDIAWLPENTATTVSLIDETDQGYYVLTSGKQKALFIPRADVKSVYFDSLDTGQKPK
jgi:hypothetical protein